MNRFIPLLPELLHPRAPLDAPRPLRVPAWPLLVRVLPGFFPSAAGDWRPEEAQAGQRSRLHVRRRPGDCHLLQAPWDSRRQRRARDPQRARQGGESRWVRASRDPASCGLSSPGGLRTRLSRAAVRSRDRVTG